MTSEPREERTGLGRVSLKRDLAGARLVAGRKRDNLRERTATWVVDVGQEAVGRRTRCARAGGGDRETARKRGRVEGNRYRRIGGHIDRANDADTARALLVL